MSDIASIAADLSAALDSGNAMQAEQAKAAYAAFLAEGVDVVEEEEEEGLLVEPVEVEVGDAPSDEDLDVQGLSVEGVDIDAIADAELGDS